MLNELTDTLTEEEKKKLALEFVRRHLTAVLATSSRSNETSAALMYFIVDDDFTFHFLTSGDSQKVRNIEQNTYVTIVVGFGPSIATIQIGGDAELHNNAKPHLFWELIKKIELQDIFQWPLAHLAKGGGYVEITVKPRWMLFLDFEKKKKPLIFPLIFHHDFLKAPPEPKSEIAE